VDDDGGLRLGAMTTFTELLEHPGSPPRHGVLAEMLGQLGSVLHRNSATIGGHVARAGCRTCCRCCSRSTRPW
jgi:CO/xanthine dehydrogenase FAD-binding subunit